MRNIIFTVVIYLLAQVVSAQSIRDKISDNPRLSAHTYLAYPDRSDINYTEAPYGYVPFHIEHYGRHGSRWLTSPEQYAQPVEALEKADRHGFLTEKGKSALLRLKIVKAASLNREGELSALGAKQHRDIAKRMTRNFPEVFAGRAHIEARSTVVIRCILSMENECQEFKAFNPDVEIFHDASHADMYFMNYYDDHIKAVHDSARSIYKDMTAGMVNPRDFICRLIADERFATDSIDAMLTMEHIFDVASNMQSHDFDFDLYDLFTPDELYALWERWNMFWYLGYGNSAELAGKLPFIQRNLLKNIIAGADSAIASGRNGASLRFGHEVCVLPLACLMELGDCNKCVTSAHSLADEWQAHEIFPMACNIQIVFYRNPSNENILVKVLLNEKEVTLPIESDTAPYYRWHDLRSYYMSKLAEPLLK